MAESSDSCIPVLHKKRSKSAISVMIPEDPFTEKWGLGIEDVRRLTEEKIYWTNEARAWKERALELMSALKDISEIKHLPSDVESILDAAEVRGMKAGPVSLSLHMPRAANKKKNVKKRKEPVEVVLLDDSTEKKGGKIKKSAASEAMKRLSLFLLDQPQGIESLLDHVPIIDVRNGSWKTITSRFHGPAQDSDPLGEDKDAIQSHQEIAAGLCISTYPFLDVSTTGGIKEQAGSPNCDFYTCSLYSSGCVVACVTDGCGWGQRSKNASQTANQTFMDYVERQLPLVTDLQQAALLLMKAVQEAHEKIVEGARRAWEVGTTTLCGGVLFQVSDEMLQEFGAPYAFLCVNIGDCKAYYCTQRTAGGETKKSGSTPLPSPGTSPIPVTNSSDSILNSGHSSSRDSLAPTPKLRWNVTDITTGNRISDVKTAGGHLGPKSGPNETALLPDLGNFTIHLTPCSKGDMFVLVSDGVHDNLDPESLNIEPQQVGLSYATWDDVPIEERTRAKDIYRSDLVAQQVDNTRSPSEIVVNMLKWVRKVTENKRQFMETNTGKEEPAHLPGKMDHTTLVVFSVD